MLKRDQELLGTICEILECEYREIPETLKGQIELAISNHSQESFLSYAQVRWTPEDIISEVHDLHNIDLSEDQALDFLERNSKYISEAMTQAGYNVINDEIDSLVAEAMAEEAEALKDNLEDR